MTTHFRCDQCEDEPDEEEQVIMLCGRNRGAFIPFYLCERCAGEMLGGIAERVERMRDQKAREGEWRDD